MKNRPQILSKIDKELMAKQLVQHRLRLMVNTNAPWAPSGYAQQARQFLPLMAREGYPTACVAFYGLEGGIISLDDVLFYPKIASQWGDDAMISHSKHFKADIIFTLQDIWTLDPNALKELAKQGKRWIPIVPIDMEPVPPAIFERLKLAYRVITYSPFGHRELQRNGMHSTYIPHTVDLSIYKKLDKKAIRKAAGLPEDTFLFGMVAANKDNPPRKSFDVVMDAFKLFHDKHPNSAIYFHTLTRQAGGFQIEDYAKHLGIEKCVYHSEPYDMLYTISPSDMAKVYSSFDCLLIPSQNEGFGVPIIEASACEVPVITTDFTAMRDLVVDGVTGYKVRVASKRFTPLNSYVAVPDTMDLYEKMEAIFNTDREEMGRKGRCFVEDNFSLDKVWKEKWIPFLSKLENEVYPQN